MKGRKVISALALGGAFAMAGSAHALIFQFGTEFTGSSGNAILPAGRLTITQDSTNKVKCVLENLVPTDMGYLQYISLVALNVDPYPTSGRSESHSSPVDKINWDKDKSESGRKFDVQIELKTSSGSRLGPGMSTTFYLEGLGLLESHFLSTSPDHPDTYGFIHVQSTPNGGSNKLLAEVVPEPASLTALSAGLLFIRRRRNKA